VKRLVQPLLPRELGQAQGELRVRDDLRPVVDEPGRGEAPVQRVALADPDPVPAMQLRKGNALRRILRMEVEREPCDLGAELAPCLLGRDLAEPAERSDVVAPDEDRVLVHRPNEYLPGQGRVMHLLGLSPLAW
jgi:hypothetical protein